MTCNNNGSTVQLRNWGSEGNIFLTWHESFIITTELIILVSGAVVLINEKLTVMLTNGQNICRGMNDLAIQ